MLTPLPFIELFAAAEVEWLAPPALGPPLLLCPLIELRMSASIPLLELEDVGLGKTEDEEVRWRAR